MIKISKAIIKKDDDYLLLKRAMHSKAYPGKWDFAGGKDEPDELPAESVRREVREETDLEIDPGDLISSVSYFDEQNEKVLVSYFNPKSTSGELKLSADHTEFGWFTLDEIEKLELHPSVNLFLNKLNN